MIRTHKLLKRIPRKLINDVMVDYKPKMWMEGWKQVEGNYYPKLKQSVYDSTGLTDEHHEVIFHLFTGSIYSHIDKMDKKCFIVPLHFTKTMTFHEEDKVIHFKAGEFYSFNDFNRHGISNEYGAYGLVASVSKDYSTYCKKYKF